MIESVAAYPLLTGLRGQPPAALDALATALSRRSLFAAANAYAIKCLDINPFLVRPDDPLALDVDLIIHAPRPTTASVAPSRPRPFLRLPSSAYNRPWHAPNWGSRVRGKDHR